MINFIYAMNTIYINSILAVTLFMKNKIYSMLYTVFMIRGNAHATRPYSSSQDD